MRPNSLGTRLTGLDLEAAVVPGLTGVFAPKVDSALDVVRYDALLDHFEARAGVTGLEYIIPVETIHGIQNCEEIAAASERVGAMIGPTAEHADIAKAVGFEWTPEGLESMVHRAESCWPPARSTGTRSQRCGSASTTPRRAARLQHPQSANGLPPEARSSCTPVMCRSSTRSTPRMPSRSTYRGLLETYEAAAARATAPSCMARSTSTRRTPTRPPSGWRGSTPSRPSTAASRPPDPPLASNPSVQPLASNPQSSKEIHHGGPSTSRTSRSVRNTSTRGRGQSPKPTRSSIAGSP